jgi:hypothetical protein
VNFGDCVITCPSKQQRLLEFLAPWDVDHIQNSDRMVRPSPPRTSTLIAKSIERGTIDKVSIVFSGLSTSATYWPVQPGTWTIDSSILPLPRRPGGCAWCLLPGNDCGRLHHIPWYHGRWKIRGPCTCSFYPICWWLPTSNKKKILSAKNDKT